MNKIINFAPSFKNMFSKRFILSVLFCAAIMCVLSYVWHGIILTDFIKLNRSKGKLLLFTSFISFATAIVMVKLYDLEIMHQYFKKSPIIRGVLVGLVCGLLFFFVSRLSGYTFNTTGEFKQTLVDIIWQVFEQTVGGFVIGIIFIFQYQPESED